MAELSLDARSVHYVDIDESLCNGCVLCMKACPTKAIRVKNGRALIEGVCINCMECARVCPRGAVKALTTPDIDVRENRNYVVSPSSVLFSQFGERFLPNDIFLGLRKMAFGYVHDQSYTSEIFSFALELYIKERRKDTDLPFPMISPCCPVVTRLIAFRFPSLLEHIPPLLTPRQIVAREAKRRFSRKTGVRPEEINILHITPCPALMIYLTELEKRNYTDRVIGINSIYEDLKRNMEEVEDDRVLHYSSGVGVGWGMSGGEIMGLNANCLAVSGLHETIRYLEKIEMGMFNDVDYIEFRICQEGCIGGPFTVADRYQAKRLLQRLVRMFGVERRIKYDYVIKLYKEGWFFSKKRLIPLESRFSHLSISERIERQNRVEEILKLLPKKECGLCGAPDCRTFSEDVVDGKASIDSCIFMRKQ